jgi:hypothetical protein
MRYFRLEEAERLLPEVEEHLRDALFQKAEYERVDKQIEAMLDHVRMAGGARVDSSRHQELKTQRDAVVRKLQSAMTGIEESGALLKDLDIGLLDFMARYQGRDVCLCWKLGEGTTIDHWHAAEEGFRGRKPIDDDFRANHTGEAGVDDEARKPS